MDGLLEALQSGAAFRRKRGPRQAGTHTHKQSRKSSQDMQMFQSVMSYLIYRFSFPYPYCTETCGAYESHLFQLPLPLHLYVSVNIQQQICLCSLCLCSICCKAQRPCGCGCILRPWLQRGAKPAPPMAGTTTKEEGGCQGRGVGSGILKRGTTGEGVVVE